MALYVVIVATVLIAVTNYNIQEWGWPMSRAKAWHPADQTIPKKFFEGNEQLLRTARDEYWKQFIARTAFTSSPIPGVSIDVNDLGVIGGISLVLLMMVLVVCLMREHENLYLALYKVRQFARLRDHEHGTSEANLLYHALVMSQVLASPPTLARWQNRGMLRHFGGIYILPFLAYVWVLISNFLTVDKARAYVGDTMTVVLMALQSFIALFLFGLTVLAWLNSRAMAERWSNAFRAINPVRRRVPQMSRVEWLRVPFRERFRRADAQPVVDGGCHARTVTEIVDTFRAKQPDRFWVRISEASVSNIGERITREQLHDMTRQVCLRGFDAAREWMKETGRAGRPKLAAFTTTDNCESGREWKINGTWEFEIGPVDTTAIELLRQHGLLLLEHRKLLSVATIIAGEKISGSWGTHPKGHEIFAWLEEVRERDDVIATRLIAGEVTFVDRALWPALFTVATSNAPWQRRELSAAAKKLLDELPSRATGPAARELQERLLVHAEEVRGETGRREVELQEWEVWAKKRKVEALANEPAAREKLEAAVAGIGGSARLLPWH